MKRYCFLLIAITLVVIGCQQEKVELKIQDIPATTAACIKEQGPYSKVEATFEELGKWLSENEIKPIGPPIGIYYDNPEEVPADSLEWEICFPIAQKPESIEVDTTTNVMVRELPAVKVATMIHVGPYEKVGKTWGKLFSAVMKSEYEPAGPSREVFLSDPEEVPGDSLRTSLQLPIKKKEQE